MIKQEVESGRQAYIVYPLIDESETLSAKAATIEAEKLQQEIFLNSKSDYYTGNLKMTKKKK